MKGVSPISDTLLASNITSPLTRNPGKRDSYCVLTLIRTAPEKWPVSGAFELKQSNQKVCHVNAAPARVCR
jgi:hypothetical protein